MREEKEKALDASVEHLKRVLSAVQEVRKGAGIVTVGDLARFKTTGDLATLRNLGKHSVEEVRKKAEDFGVIIEKSDRVTIPARKQRDR